MAAVITDPNILSEHTLDACRRYQPTLNPLLALALLDRARRVLEAVPLRFFLCFGTLLGAVRNQQFIPHDDDVDIGIFAEDMPVLLDLLQRRKFADEGKGLMLMRQTPHLLSVELFGQYLDIYVWTKRDGRYWCDFYSMDARHLENGLDSLMFYGRLFGVPKHVADYLTYTYGDWQTPKKGLHASR